MKISSLKLSKALVVLFLAIVIAVTSLLFVSQAQATAQGYYIYSWGLATNNRLGRTPVANESPHNRPARATPTIPTASAPSGPVWISVATAMNRSIAVNTSGELWGWGVGHTGFERLGDPNKTNWVSVAGQDDNKSAIDSDGHLYTWSPPGERTLGRTGQREVPQRVQMSEQPNLPNSTTWIRSHSGDIGNYGVGSGGVGILIGITNEGSTNGVAHGRLFAAGNVPAPLSNPAGTPMTGDWGVELTGNNGVHFVEIGGGANNWVDVVTTNYAIAALNTNGEIWTVGRGIPGVYPASQLGRAVDAANPAHLIRPVQPYGGTSNSWVSMAGNAYQIAAVHESGRLYTWGVVFAAFNSSGRYAHAANPAPPHFMPGAPPPNRPGQVGTDSNWIRVLGGTSHFLAFNGNGYLYGWGNSANGQIGSMDNPPQNPVLRPVRVLRAASTVVSDIGGDNSIVLLREPLAEGEFSLSKELQKPYGTPVPNVTFTFTMVARSFNGASAANFTDNFPINSTNLVRSITINNASVTSPASPTAGDVVTLSSSTNLLEGITFGRTGDFSWTIREVEGSSQTSAPSNVVYSQAVYDFTVHVRRQASADGWEFYIAAVTLHRLYDFYGEEVDPPYKVDGDFIFTNKYTRTTTGTTDCYGALWISKTVDGFFFNSDTSFIFDITLTGTGLCAPNREFTGRVYAGTTFVREEGPFVSGTAREVTLLDGQRIIFPALTVGTQFAAIERAIADFAASVVLYVNGTAVNVAPNQSPNLPLSIGGPHLIGADLRNSADFTNEHFHTPPTGLLIANTPWIAVLATTLLLALLAAKRNRKRIEQIPLVF